MEDVVLETDRLLLRPWIPDDAPALYPLAASPVVGPACGWAPHANVSETRMVIRNVLMGPESYAIVSKDTYDIIGAVSLKFHRGAFTRDDSEPEVGFWLGEPYWGHRFAEEAVAAVIERSFTVLDCVAVWACYFDDNERAHKVLERLHFIYEQTEPWVTTTTGKHARHEMCLTRDRWPMLSGERGGRPFAMARY